MTVTEWARAEEYSIKSAQRVAKRLNVGTWSRGRRDLTLEDWEAVRVHLKRRPGRPKKNEEG